MFPVLHPSPSRSQQRDTAKAIEWFKRALRIDRKCLAAWTLMGHEFLELRNCGEREMPRALSLEPVTSLSYCLLALPASLPVPVSMSMPVSITHL